MRLWWLWLLVALLVMAVTPAPTAPTLLPLAGGVKQTGLYLTLGGATLLLAGLALAWLTRRGSRG